MANEPFWPPRSRNVKEPLLNPVPIYDQLKKVDQIYPEHETDCKCETCGQKMNLEQLVKAGLVKDIDIIRKKGMIRPELFLITREIISATDNRELAETYMAMQELGLAHLPYRWTDIGIPANSLMRFKEQPGEPLIGFKAIGDWAAANGDPFKEMELRFQYHRDIMYRMLIKNSYGVWTDMNRWINQSSPEGEACKESGVALARMLIVLLATKNIVKTRVKDKLLSMGIGKNKNNHRPLYTTTLSLPRPEHMEYVGDHAPGTSPRPHLRRGHIRNQKHGPSLQYVKRIWIQPVFVNADENFVSARTAYNTSTKELK